MRSLLACLLLLPLAVVAQTSTRLGKSLDRLLGDTLFEAGDVSIVVYDLTDGRQLYAHREHKTVRPASVQKVMTSVVALDRLGSSYTIDTELLGSASANCNNLYVKGCVDPLFSDVDMKRMAMSVPAGTVVDTLFADCSFTDSLYWGPGWMWDDNPYGYQPYLSPLMVCGGAVEINVWPSGKGRAPHYEVTPRSSFYTVVNEAESHNPELPKLTVLRDWLDNSNIIRIRGNCTAPYKESINMYRSADFFLAMLVEKLAAEGVEVRNTAFSKTPQDARLLHRCSRYLVDVVDEALQESDNLCAEALLYHLAAAENLPPHSMEQGCAVMRAYMTDSIGISRSFAIVDGSGLSTYNFTSAAMVVEALKYAHGNSAVFDVLYGHLPQSGVSGTMKRRTAGTAAYKKVRAKTGTIRGVCSLAGYALAADGHLYAFAIMNSGLQKPSHVREWQDKVLDAICK